MHTVNVRNLDQIQELEGRPRASKLGALVLAAMGLGAVAVVAAMNATGARTPAPTQGDALAKLVESSRGSQPSGPAATQLSGTELGFPAMLSDSERPTTALAAVKDDRGRLVPQLDVAVVDGVAGSAVPPEAMDRLAVVPLPAGNILTATAITNDPKDPLTTLAVAASQPSANGESAPAGSDGGFQLQVASFKSAEEADKYAQQLRQRGHAAYRQAAVVPDKGLWHRVRIGPFDSGYAAEVYRRKLEAKERLHAFVVDPDKVKRVAEARAAKLAAGRKVSGAKP
jgi:DedD protein